MSLRKKSGRVGGGIVSLVWFLYFSYSLVEGGGFVIKE